ncbi:hypothetical protein U1701_04150 [Sphingomonas sp. PB2P19]|uniref:hypothetical protein n=1 Tax=Sphingomonas rhamnosi TaxID=3096156 RepID=UPI002FCAE807
MTKESGNGAGNAAVLVSPCTRGGAKVKRASATWWTHDKRERFLDMVAATANVRMAAQDVGMSLTGAYALRRRDAAFAALWEEALEQGYGRLEAELLSSALGEAGGENGVESESAEGRVSAHVNAIAPDGDRAAMGMGMGAGAGPIDPALGLNLLALRRAATGPRKTQKRNYKTVPIAEVERAVMKQLEIAERRLRRALGTRPGGRAGGGSDGGADGRTKP